MNGIGQNFGALLNPFQQQTDSSGLDCRSGVCRPKVATPQKQSQCGGLGCCGCGQNQMNPFQLSGLS